MKGFCLLWLFDKKKTMTLCGGWAWGWGTVCSMTECGKQWGTNRGRCHSDEGSFLWDHGYLWEMNQSLASPQRRARMPFCVHTASSTFPEAYPSLQSCLTLGFAPPLALPHVACGQFWECLFTGCLIQGLSSQGRPAICSSTLPEMETGPCLWVMA